MRISKRERARQEFAVYIAGEVFAQSLVRVSATALLAAAAAAALVLSSIPEVLFLVPLAWSAFPAPNLNRDRTEPNSGY